MTNGHKREGGGLPGAGRTPLGNPPGLPQIAYRAGDFAAFRRALLSPLAGEQQLTNWAPNAGDLGLQALEWWAYLADILTFYNERIANGSYLGTAVAQPGPSSAAGLAALLGYLATPAVTATGVVAVTRSAGGQDGPLVIPAGLQITSTPTATAPAQLFEVTQGAAFTGPSDAVIGLPADPGLFRPAADAETPTRGATQQAVLLTGQIAVSPGDLFVLVKRDWAGTSADWAVVTAQSAAAEKEPDGRTNTRLTLSSADWHGLGATPAPAPLASDYQLQRAVATAALWTMTAGVGGQLAVGGANPPAGPAPQTLTVPLATVARALSPGDNVLFTGSTGGASPRVIQLLAQVTGYTEEVARVPAMAAGTAGAARTGTQPDVYISHTNLTVTTAGADGDVAALRSVLGTSALGGIVLRYGFRAVGDPGPAPAMALEKLPVTVTVPVGLRVPDGPVALQDAVGAGLLVTAAAATTPGTVTLAPANGAPGTVSPALRAPIRLLADLVPVSQGTTVTAEVLGDGNPAAASQAFTLRHAPLIYLPPAQPGGDPVSTLSVSVDGIAWHEVRTFSGQPPAAVYVVSQLPDGSVQVQFGDGNNGARLPFGTGNVTAGYRYGAPAPPPPAGSLATVLQPQPNLGAVSNPVDITPGTAQETSGETAAAAPATVLLLPGATSASPPLISLSDSERIAATVSGVTRVRAYWSWDQESHRPAIAVYVGSDGDTAAAVTAVGRLFPRGASRMPLRAVAARSVSLVVGCRLLGAPGAGQDAVRAAATGALADLFGPVRMAIGQRLYRSEVEGALTAGGLAAVLSLSVHRQGDEPGPGSVLDPGQDGYFGLSAGDLSISVVTR